MSNNIPPMVLGIDKLCETLAIGKNTAYELLSKGEIDCFKVGSCWKIPVSSVEEYIKRKCNERKKELCVLLPKNNENV